MEEYFEGLDSKGKKAFIKQVSEDVDDENADDKDVDDDDINLPKVINKYINCSVLIYAYRKQGMNTDQPSL